MVVDKALVYGELDAGSVLVPVMTVLVPVVAPYGLNLG